MNIGTSTETCCGGLATGIVYRIRRLRSRGYRDGHEDRHRHRPRRALRRQRLERNNDSGRRDLGRSQRCHCRDGRCGDAVHDHAHISGGRYLHRRCRQLVRLRHHDRPACPRSPHRHRPRRNRHG